MLARSTLALTGWGMLMGCGALAAQKPGDSTIIDLPPIHVHLVLPERTEFTPGAVGILTPGDFRAFRPLTLHDALDFIPGVRTIDDDVLGRRSGIGIRAAPPRRSRKTLLLEDGTAVNASTYLDPSAHYTPPMERLERVEVLKGAGQIVHGPLNNHGVINFRNKRPTATPETTVELGGGSTRILKRHAMHSRTAGPLGLVLAYTGLNADGTFDVERHQFDDFFGSLTWSLGEGHDLAMSLIYFRERAEGYDEANLTPEQFAMAPRSKSVLAEGRENNNFSLDYVKGDLTHDLRLSSQARISTKFFVTDLDRPRFQTHGSAPSAGGVMEGRDRWYRTLGAESRVEARLGRGLGADHTVQAGLRHEWHWFDDTQPVGRPGEILNSGNRGNPFAVAGAGGYTRDGRMTTFTSSAFSVFLQNAIQLRNWILTPGVRLESFNQKRHVEFFPGDASEGSRETDGHAELLLGIGVLYLGIGASQLFGSVHRGLAPASARTEEFPLIPEEGLYWQMGVRSRPIPALSAEASAFYGTIKNTIIREDADVLGDGLFVNAADSRAYGVDLGGRMSSSPLSGGALNIFTQVAYNFTRAEFSRGPLDGNRVPEVPLHAGSITLGFERLAAWSISATVSHLGDFFADKENSEGLHADRGRVPGRTLLSGRASFTLTDSPGLTLWIQGRNLTNRLYVSDVQDGLRPGAPRSVIGGITMRF